MTSCSCGTRLSLGGMDSQGFFYPDAGENSQKKDELSAPNNTAETGNPADINEFWDPGMITYDPNDGKALHTSRSSKKCANIVSTSSCSE